MAENITQCAEDYVGFISMTVYGILFGVYGSVSLQFIKHPNSFHPFFVTSFFLILSVYTVAFLVLFIRNLLDLTMQRNVFFGILEFLYIFSTNYTQPVVVLTLMERVIATVLVKKYESTKNWISYFVAQGICISIVVFMTLFSVTSVLVTNIQTIISIFVCIVLMILLILNRKMTENSRARLTLSTRYQLAENIKALRIFVPFILMDCFISIMFVFTRITLNVGRTFDNDLCVTYEGYVGMFLIFRTIAIFTQISMASSVIYQHESLQFSSCGLYGIINNTSKVEPIGEKKLIKIKNVLGKNISDISEQETGENYFAQLHAQWK